MTGRRLATNATGTFVRDRLGGISVFSIGADGSLTQLSRFSDLGAVLYGIAAVPNAALVYAINSNPSVAESAGVLGFSVGTSGTITKFAATPFANINPREIVVDSSGKFVYVSAGAPGKGGIFGFTIDSSTGVLTLIPGSPFASPPDPVQLAIDPSSSFLYVANGNLSGRQPQAISRDF